MATWVNYIDDNTRLPTKLQRGWATDFTDWLGFSSGVDTEAIGALNNLTGLNLSADAWYDFLIKNYGTKTGGFLGEKFYDIDYNTFNTHLNNFKAALESRPVAPIAQDYLDDARAQAYSERDAALDELAALYDVQVGMYNDELQSLASGYNTSRAGVLSQQYQQNAQLMDTFSSQMDRGHRNALEAGASAGLRLAGNINTLLSVQNKQSQTSLDTANQLAQMMVSQRNAEASVRGRYGDYLQQNFATKQGIKDSAESKAQNYYNTNYGAAESSYNTYNSQWNEANQFNPFWEHRNNSKFNKTGG